MTTVVAAIDCGTNSVRLLVAEATSDGLRDLHREMRIVRLGQGVDRTGRLAPEALARSEAALADYAAVIGRLDAARVRLVATSATRDAANRGEFAALVRDTLGVEPEVVSGRDEAALSYSGAASVLGPDTGPLLVADIGGGSTELVLGGDGPLHSHSMDVGAVRMTERHLGTGPLTHGEVEAVESDVRTALDHARVDVPFDDDATLVGVAGTVTTVAALALGLDRYDPDVLHGARLSRERIDEVTDRLVRSTPADREAMTVIHPGRRDVIAGGALVLRTLVDELGFDALTVSEHDILDGIALSIT
ncbi:Ppx/GppA phosphatase family protein [Jatrophihabitans endophyticus]|uniref:Ppx/GppA phosphatase family protein n=1 Tax=Jatrophihabitans endophyticus TaxID=1206085 RepID=UPI001A0F30C5|nr:Ppx/GppA phosphatase family protein [Jatrophihabitans endophyticus]MBE7188574.1 Ppx/GppA family phosphatase [Jatrophihabitans endophyticus]